MKPPSFAYHDPETLDEAVALLAEHGDDAKVLAGGQSLVPMLNFRLLSPANLIDINRIAALKGIRVTDAGLTIGAATRQRAIERSADVRRLCPLLSDVMPNIAHIQIRNRGTVGGSLAHADPAAELPAVMTALDATLVVRGASGERTFAAGDFFTGYLTTALQPDELLAEIRIPAEREGSGTAFLEVSRRHGDFALVGVAARLALDEAGCCTFARVVLTGVAETPFRLAEAEAALVGTPVAEADRTGAAERIAVALTPPTDLHASADYRRNAARVLTERTIALAAERAKAARRVSA